VDCDETEDIDCGFGGTFSIEFGLLGVLDDSVDTCFERYLVLIIGAGKILAGLAELIEND
jgi:hypothetical protein